MSGDDHRHTARASAFVSALVVALATSLSATLVTLGPDAPLAAAVAVLALAVGGLVRVSAGGVLAVRPAPWPGARQPVPALASLVTDPTRHPVRPRAPGTV